MKHAGKFVVEVALFFLHSVCFEKCQFSGEISLCKEKEGRSRVSCVAGALSLYNLLSGVAFFESSSRSNRLMSRSVRDKVHNNDILADFLGSHVRADYTIQQCTFLVSGLSSFRNLSCVSRKILSVLFFYIYDLSRHIFFIAHFVKHDGILRIRR